ncbi:DNA repair protein RadC [Arcticibacter pallidicorallinus]|uniref:DNA repair protein RadC n=1 Tax=Arcticibacter pallidicorallinus TaxID=1259464 RepID=A0A2T0U646_9SPHI|nr:JAB domain-containing protein [Arcticibacter pallidicorallinus]PRY53380.1 DNA repair protein RadC [Arcticibacter pallidicorallinus]
MEKINIKVAEIQLSYKPKFKLSELPIITQSTDAYLMLKSSWDEMKIGFLEEFKIILLNRANKVLGICPISLGGISGTIADPKLISATALKASASGIILAHNHPSGNLKPSQVDIQLTKKLVEAGKFLDLGIVDHLIIGSEGYLSFADEGLL